MKTLKKIQICLGLNIFLLLLISSCISIFASDSKYFRFGPSEDFILISVKIDNYQKYYLLLILITCNNCIRTIVSQIGSQILIFNVYNPDKKVITEFTKSQLLFYANTMFFVGNIRVFFELLLTISQIDIALFSIFVKQLFSIGISIFLLNEKDFIKSI